MNDRMSDMDALVDVAARAMYDAARTLMRFPTDWDGAPEPLRETYQRMARAALLAVGLPALLERAEAAEAWEPENGDTKCQRCHQPNVCWFADNALWNEVTDERETILCLRCFAALCDERLDKPILHISLTVKAERDALLERVEEAEAKVGPDADLAAARRLYEWITEIREAEGDPDWDDLDVMAQGVWLQGARQVGTDALAAKVAVAEATPTNLREHLSATIRWRLVAANMSQADAAAFVGVSQKHLSQILNGRQDGSLSMWQRLLDFVNTDARAALDASETP